MRRRRRRGRAEPLSLFAFQDIITSLTGIMMLIVVLLVIEVLMSVPAAPREDEIASPVVPRAEVEDAIAAATQRLRELEETQRERANAIEQATELRMIADQEDPASLAAEIEDMEERAARLEENLRNMAVTSEERARRRELADEKARLSAQLSALEEEIRTVRSDDVVLVTVPPTVDKRPLLVECSAGNVRVLWHGASGQTKEFVSSGSVTMQKAANDLLEWLESRDPSRERVVLYLKPEFAPAARQLIVRLKERDWTVGWEPLREDARLELLPEEDR